MIANQLSQIALASDEAHDGHGTAGVGGLYELGELLRFSLHERKVADARRQPEDQLVQQQHHGAVTERLGVGADRGETPVDVEETFTCRGGLQNRRRSERGHIGSDQVLTPGIGRGRSQAPLDGVNRPLRGEVSPVVGCSARCVQPFDESFISDAGPQVGQFGRDDLISEEHSRQRGPGMESPDAFRVATQDLVLHGAGVEEMDRHEQELLRVESRSPLCYGLVQFGLGSGVGVVAQQQVQHGHEVRLARSEAPLEVRGLRLPVANSGGHEAERFVERPERSGL